MELKELISNSKIIDDDKIYFDEPMSKYTSFKIGGNAECLIKINSESDLKKVLKFSIENNVPINIIGNGSNLLVLDKGIKGIVLKIQIQDYTIVNQNEENVSVIVSSGFKIGTLGKKLEQNSITGFEELSGIPGTIGGAIKMNAGAYGKEIKDIVKKVKCIDYDGNEIVLDNKDMEFSYRSSILKNKKYIVLEVELELKKGNIDEIKQKSEEYAKSRLEKQPLEFPNAGSTFKRGEDYITAKLIDEAGLKGYSIGGAEVSLKHSGFIINKGNATAKDVLDLVDYIKDKVFEKFGERIELEIEVIGEK